MASDRIAVNRAPRRLTGRVVALEDATHDIKVVRLGDPSGGPLAFAAGQYARVFFSDLPPRDYSMANRPDDPTLEFHIRRTGGDGASEYVANTLAVGETVAVEGPFGDAGWRSGHPGPIIAIAGGSGLAPIKSIVETAIAAGVTRDIHFYFGVRQERDLYLEAHFRALAARHANFRFVPVLSEPADPGERRGGLVGDAVAADFDGFPGFKAYLAGPPRMVEAAVAMLATRGMAVGDIHADPFYSDAEQAARQQKP